MRVLMLMSALLLSFTAVASEDHGIGKIQNEDMDLSYIDHILTGRIGDRPVFAKPLEGEFGISLFHRAGGTNYETEFRKVEDTFVGPVTSLNADGDAIDSEYRVTEFSAEDGTVSGIVGEKTFKVTVTADTMDGHHYINPHFHIEFGDMSFYEFDLENSQACMGCIMKLSYVIVSMLYTVGAI